MDCEKFDRIVLEKLYGELDELTHAAAKRHAEHCMRCRRIDTELRATREVGVLPMLEPPPDLLSRILTAERHAHAALPARKRVGRAISIMAAYAMRPELAMAALLLLMIGGSLLFLRARPGDPLSTRVAERGVPEGEGDSVPIVPVPEKLGTDERSGGAQAHGALPDDTKEFGRRDRKADDEPRAKREAEPKAAADEPVASAPLQQGPIEDDAGVDVAYGEAMAAFNEGRYADAQHRFEDIASAGGAKAAAASLLAAQSARNGAGCGMAANRFEEVADRFPGTGVGNEASWQAADCYRALGQFDKARRHYRALLATGYAGRAQGALAELDSPAKSAKSKAAAKARPPSKEVDALPGQKNSASSNSKE